MLLVGRRKNGRKIIECGVRKMNSVVNERKLKYQSIVGASASLSDRTAEGRKLNESNDYLLLMNPALRDFGMTWCGILDDGY